MYVCVCIYLCVCIYVIYTHHTYIHFLTLTTERPRSSNISVAMSTSSTQKLASKYYSPNKMDLGEVGDSRPGAGNIQDEAVASCRIRK